MQAICVTLEHEKVKAEFEKKIAMINFTNISAAYYYKSVKFFAAVKVETENKIAMINWCILKQVKETV